MTAATTQYQVVIIGGSAGSLEALLPMLTGLPKSFHLPVIIVIHRNTDNDGLLTELIATRSGKKTMEAEEKQSIEKNHIYIAPADYHLLIEKNKTFSLDYSEKINYSRPSIDVTFETIAEAYGATAIAMLLSGANEDGVNGIAAIKKSGGMILIQDPATAAVPYMPEKAVQKIRPDKTYAPQAMKAILHTLK